MVSSSPLSNPPPALARTVINLDQGERASNGLGWGIHPAIAEAHPMITQNTDRPEGTLEFTVTGYVTGNDYETVLAPAIESDGWPGAARMNSEKTSPSWR